MGRKKISIEEIRDERTRQVCFGKRKLGLMKKALELSILCRCEIGILVFSSNGNLHQWSSPRTSMQDLVQRYNEATSRSDSQHDGKEVVDVLSDLGSDAEDDAEVDDDQDVQHCFKRKRENAEGAGDTLPARQHRSASPASEEDKPAPSSLDLRLNAAAMQCSKLTPRSEKALSEISREFDNIFSQLSASESVTPAHTQDSPERAPAGCLALSPGLSDLPACSHPEDSFHNAQVATGPPKIKREVNISAWAADSSAEVRSAVMKQQPQQQGPPVSVPHAHPPPVSWALARDAHSPSPPTTLTPSTTSAFSVPVRPVPSSILPASAALLCESHCPPHPASTAGLHHSSASAFTPACSSSSHPLGGCPPLRAPTLHSLQMAVLPVPMGMAPPAGMALSPWPLSHPQPLRASAEQLQELVRGGMLSGGPFSLGVHPPAPAMLAPAATLATGGGVPMYIPRSSGNPEVPSMPTQVALSLS